MSRAIDFKISEVELKRRCALDDVKISVLEGLPQGGTRLVCVTPDGAALMRRRYAKDIFDKPQKRNPFFVPALQK